jgi:hypothetical protein
MAEAVVLVCDECGRPDAKTITIRTGSGNYVKDLCDQHLTALLANTRAPRRGRPRGRGAANSNPARSRSGRTPDRKRTSSKRRSKRKTASKKTAATSK